jgi:hypothetical protein
MMRRLRNNTEAGLALVTVIGTAGVLFVLTSIIAIQSVSNLRSVGVETRHETAVQVSDSGIDLALFELNKSELWNTGESSPASFASAAAERTWALAAATTAATNAPATRLKRSPEGEYVVVKPSNSSLIYSVGWVPSFSAPTSARKVRVLRASYGSTSLPTNNFAFLTNGDLEFGNKHLDVKFGSVHANGDMTITGKGKIDGAVTATGGYYKPGDLKIGDVTNSGGGRPAVGVPIVKPQDYYSKSQYDLCPDGTVRGGPENPDSGKRNSGTTPCGGPILVSNATSGYRGWKPVTVSGTYGQVWKYDTKTPYDGVYYIKDGSAWLAQKIKKWNVTVLAAATGNDCNKVGGDIVMRDGTHDNLNPHSGGEGILFMAGRDFDHGDPYVDGDKKDFVTGRGHSHKLNGLVYAYEHFSAGKDHFRIDGSIIAAAVDGCNSPGSPVSRNITGHAHIKYVPTQLVPADKIRVTAWEEL